MLSNFHVFIYSIEFYVTLEKQYPGCWLTFHVGFGLDLNTHVTLWQKASVYITSVVCEEGSPGLIKAVFVLAGVQHLVQNGVDNLIRAALMQVHQQYHIVQVFLHVHGSTNLLAKVFTW